MFVVIISSHLSKMVRMLNSNNGLPRQTRHSPALKASVHRKLLKPLEEGNYAAVVELESHAGLPGGEHSSSIHDKAGEEVRPLFDGKPPPRSTK